jgi:hypothetical protein
VREHDGISAQVLQELVQEFYVVATRKVSVLMSPRLALQCTDYLDGYPCIANDYELVKLGAFVSMR